jgi:hypothetical protein
MSIQENQHYVPKFYLRCFSNQNNPKEIGIYNIKTGFSFEKAPIKGQAYKPYFYGKDLSVENWLGKLENLTSFCFNGIIKHCSFPSKSINYKDLLLKFVLLFELRNPVGAQNMEDSFNLLAKHIPDFPKLPEGTKIKITDPVLIWLSVGDKAFACCKDLQLKLLLNYTTVPFISSDNPKIKYNQFLERHNYPAGIVGLGSRGLQIFFPISSALMLVFYDNTTYKIGNKKEDNIRIVDEKEIDQLNLLQCLNANEIIFYNNFTNSAYIQKLMGKTSNFKKPNKPVIEEAENYIPFEGTNNDKISKLLIHRITESRINLQLKFIKELSVAKLLTIDKKQFQIREKARVPLLQWSKE